MLEDVVRSISYYRKKADFPCGEYPLIGMELETLRALFRVTSEDPMYEVYSVGPEQAPTLEAAVGKKFDFHKYDYFLDCHAATFEELFRAALSLSERARRFLNRRRPAPALRAARDALVSFLQAHALSSRLFPTIESTRDPAWLLRTAGMDDAGLDISVIADMNVLWNCRDLSALKARAYSLVDSVLVLISLGVDRWLSSTKSKVS